MFGLFKKTLSSFLPFIGRKKENTEPEKPIEECADDPKYWHHRNTYDEFLYYNFDSCYVFDSFSDLQIIGFGHELIEKWGIEPGYAIGMVARLFMKKYSNNEAYKRNYYLYSDVHRYGTCRQSDCDIDLSTSPKCFCNDPTQRYGSFLKARANGEIEIDLDFDDYESD